MQKIEHVPVMLDEAVEALHIKKNYHYIDATLGAGGHSALIIKKGGKILGFENDPKMIPIAKKKISSACPGMNQEVHDSIFKIVNDNFANISKYKTKPDYDEFFPVCGVLFDLGVSNFHLKRDDRGFSFEKPENPLDMRLNPETASVKASDLLNALREDQLIDLFSDYLGKNESKRLARLICEQREDTKFEFVSDFLDVVARAKVSDQKSPATKPFMALRIAVNSELLNLKEGLEGALEVLVNSGRIVVISFHSGEDRIVKEKFSEWKMKGFGVLKTKKPIEPDDREIKNNPKARSAKMRIFEKTKNHL